MLFHVISHGRLFQMLVIYHNYARKSRSRGGITFRMDESVYPSRNDKHKYVEMCQRGQITLEF